jgi:hypothetical protein
MVLGGKSLNYLDPGREPCEYGVGKRNPCLYMFALFKTVLARITYLRLSHVQTR